LNGHETDLSIRSRGGYPLHQYLPPYPEQESDEIGDEVIARFNPNAGQIENLEVLFFSTRLLRSNLFELPVTADLRLVTKE
jgi:hypothetical protein